MHREVRGGWVVLGVHPIRPERGMCGNIRLQIRNYNFVMKNRAFIEIHGIFLVKEIVFSTFVFDHLLKVNE